MCRIAETGTGPAEQQRSMGCSILIDQSDACLAGVERMMPHDDDGQGDLGKTLTPPRWHPPKLGPVAWGPFLGPEPTTLPQKEVERGAVFSFFVCPSNPPAGTNPSGPAFFE
jgi:hypothetical protein